MPKVTLDASVQEAGFQTDLVDRSISRLKAKGNYSGHIEKLLKSTL